MIGIPRIAGSNFFRRCGVINGTAVGLNLACQFILRKRDSESTVCLYLKTEKLLYPV